jgi:hypothetical protein
MDPNLQELVQRCNAAQERGRSLLDRQQQLIDARRRLRRHGVSVLEEFADLARTFCDRAAGRHERKE